MSRGKDNIKRDEVLRMINGGYTNEEIAAALHCGKSMVWRVKKENGIRSQYGNPCGWAKANGQKVTTAAERREEQLVKQLKADQSEPTATALHQRQNAIYHQLVRAIANGNTTRAAELQREYVNLGLKIEYAETQANSAQRELGRSRATAEKTVAAHETRGFGLSR